MTTLKTLSSRNEALLVFLAALVIVGVIVLLALSIAVPQPLWGLLFVLVAGALGVSSPTSSGAVSALESAAAIALPTAPPVPAGYVLNPGPGPVAPPANPFASPGSSPA